MLADYLLPDDPLQSVIDERLAMLAGHHSWNNGRPSIVRYQGGVRSTVFSTLSLALRAIVTHLNT